MTEPQERQAWWSSAIRLDSIMQKLSEDADAKRTVVAERDMPRVREWINQAVAHAVNDAAQALNSIRYWCLQTEKTIAEHQAEEGEGHGCEWCAALGMAVRQVRRLLPALAEATERRGDLTGGGDGMDGTRVTRGGEDDRELGFGGDDDEAAFGGSETGGGN